MTYWNTTTSADPCSCNHNNSLCFVQSSLNLIKKSLAILVDALDRHLELRCMTSTLNLLVLAGTMFRCNGVDN